MKSTIKKVGDTVVVSFDGKIDYETNEPLKADLDRLNRHAKSDSVPKNIIFDFQKLEFVGSSGISPFVQTLKEFSATLEVKPRYCNVRSEFQRIMKALDSNTLFEFHENEDRAHKSFNKSHMDN